MATVTLPLGTEAEVRGMKGREEDILANRKKLQSGEAWDEILANCALRLGTNTKVQPGDIKRLKSPDRAALLFAVRRVTFGDAVEADLQCAACRHKFAADVDLTQLPSKPAPEGEAPYEVSIDVDGTPVKVLVDFLDGRQEVSLARSAASGEDIATAALLAVIREVEGVHANDKRTWLRDLPMRARRDLRKAIEALDCGIQSDVTVHCPSCDEEIAFDVQAVRGFFPLK